MQGKQAKMLSPTQERAILSYLATTRYPHRDRVMFLLSIKAGLRAKEMTSLTWAMVTDAEGQLMETIHLDNRASKGKTGGRTIPMHPDVQDALTTLQTRAGRCWGKPQNSDKMTCPIHWPLEPGEALLCASHCNSSSVTMTVTKKPSPMSSPLTRITNASNISG